ncbi:hypothetical protein GCM10011359_09510 [Nesterenkonia alkaliphila]|nr:hypothetical protein GCM10011359_09510 [Nesterenkonia alkaliphila]
MSRFTRKCALSTLGSFLREFRFGHVRQLDDVASRVLQNLAADASLLKGETGSPKGAAKIVRDALAALHRLQPTSSAQPLLRRTKSTRRTRSSNRFTPI